MKKRMMIFAALPVLCFGGSVDFVTVHEGVVHPEGLFSTPAQLEAATGELARALAPIVVAVNGATGAVSVTQIYSPSGERWIDGTGGVWRISYETNYTVALSPVKSSVWPWPSGTGAFPFAPTSTWTGTLSADTASVAYTGSEGTPLDNLTWSAAVTGTWPLDLFVGGSQAWGTCVVSRVLSPVTQRVDSVALVSQLPATNGLLTGAEAAGVYAKSNLLAAVAWDGRYSSLTNTPVVLASNGIARASHAWGAGYGGWSGWTASNIVLGASNAVLTGYAGGYIETDGTVTGIVSVTQSAVGSGGYENSAVISLSFDGGASWYPLSALPPKSERTGGSKIRVQMNETPGVPGTTPTWTLASIVCDTWIDSSRASEVFPLHAVSVTVDLPSDPLDAANKAYVDAVAGYAQQTADRALEWWNNPAQGDAYMDGHRLHLGGGWSILGDTGSFAALSNDGSVGLGVIGDSAQFSIQLASENILIARFDTAMMQITAWSGAASNMWLTVSTNGLPASPDSASAWVEYSASMDSGVWARAPTQTTVLPTNAATFRISFENPRWGQTNGFYRVMRQSGSLAALRSMVPLRAPSIMVSESNSVAIATQPGVVVVDSIAAAPSAIANHAQLYSVLGELWTMDGDGNATRLSTHDGPLWVARSVNVYTGWGTTIDMMTGKRTRFRLDTLRSWDGDQKSIESAQNEAIKRWKETPAGKRRSECPKEYKALPEPDWMKDQRLSKDDPYPIK